MTRVPKRLYAPLRWLETETPAASTELLYVKASGLFGTCVCVSRVEEGRGSGAEGGRDLLLPARQWCCMSSYGCAPVGGGEAWR